MTEDVVRRLAIDPKAGKNAKLTILTL